MKKQKIKIKLANRKLAAQLDYHDELSPRYFCLFAHCFTCTKDLKSINNLNAALTDNGFAVLRFDFTGLGSSSGEFANTNFKNNIDDLLQAAKFLEDYYQAPSLLIGHSLGGAAAIRAVQEIPSAKAVATIGTPFHPHHLQRILKYSEKERKEKGNADVMISGRKFNIGEFFYNDMSEELLVDNISKLNKPICVLHSPVDETVGIEHAEQIFNHSNHPKSFISLNKADHLMLQKNDAYYTGKMIAEWAKIYI